MPCSGISPLLHASNHSDTAVPDVLSALLLFVGAARLAKPLERLKQKHAAFNQRMVRCWGLLP
jgi:hypothetical protein